MLEFIPLFYQLYQAYRNTDLNINHQPQGQVLSSQVEITPTPTPQIETPTNIGGEGKVINIALIGDSMIETLTPEAPILKNSLSLYFPNQVFYIHNYGFPAKTIDFAHSKIHEIIRQNPDIVVLESFAYNNYGNTQEGFDKQWHYLGAITTEIKNKLPNTKIILATTIAPISVEFANGSEFSFSAIEKIEKTKTIKIYLENTKNFANSQNFYLADAYTLSLNKNNDGYRELVEKEKNIHPSSLGHQLFSDSIAKTIFDNKLL